MSSYVESRGATSARLGGLLHAFLLAQLWTLYLEKAAQAQPGTMDGFLGQYADFMLAGPKFSALLGRAILKAANRSVLN